MNPSQYVSVGAGTSILSTVLMYLTKWPLQPLTDAQATAFAGLIILLVGSCHGLLRAFLKKRGIELPPDPSTPSSNGASNA